MKTKNFFDAGSWSADLDGWRKHDYVNKLVLLKK